MVRVHCAILSSIILMDCPVNPGINHVLCYFSFAAIIHSQTPCLVRDYEYTVYPYNLGQLHYTTLLMPHLTDPLCISIFQYYTGTALQYYFSLIINTQN